MRKRICLFLLLTLFPVLALAQPDTPYPARTVMPVCALTEEAQQAIDWLYPAMRCCREEIRFPSPLPMSDVEAALRCLSRNYPELFHLGDTWTLLTYADRPGEAVGVSLTYAMTGAAYDEALSTLLERAQFLVDGVSGTETERAEQLHDALCVRVHYDASALDSGDNHAYGALVSGGTACDGYAKGLALLYRLSGIACGVVYGKSVNPESDVVTGHAWNVAFIDGTMTLIDPTWDDELGTVEHWYYGLTTDMMAADHQPDEGMTVPLCDSLALNWFARRGLLIDNEDGYLTVIDRFVREGTGSARFATQALYEDFLRQISALFDRYEDTCPEVEPFYGNYYIVTAPDQLSVRLSLTP